MPTGRGALPLTRTTVASANGRALRHQKYSVSAMFSNGVRSSLDGLEARRPGGWGIEFVRRLMDAVQYRRRRGKNLLTLARRCSRE